MAGGYAKYIGRVGALAVALGVGGAIATTPESHGPTILVICPRRRLLEFDLAGFNPGIVVVGVNPVIAVAVFGPSSSSVGQTSTASSEPSTDDSETSAVESSASTSSETVTSHGADVTVRSSGGTHTSGPMPPRPPTTHPSGASPEDGTAG